MQAASTEVRGLLVASSQTVPVEAKDTRLWRMVAHPRIWRNPQHPPTNGVLETTRDPASPSPPIGFLVLEVSPNEIEK